MEKLPGLFNARAESVASKPSSRDAFRHRRCLIPVDGFYEWKTEGRKKLPCPFTPVSALEAMLAPLPPDLMEDKPVNPWLNNSRNEGPQCYEPPPTERSLWGNS